jgi:hypothetical protein
LGPNVFLRSGNPVNRKNTVKKKLVVGQDVDIRGISFGRFMGKVVKIEPPCIWVEMGNGINRFNSDGKECAPDGRAYNNSPIVIDDPGPYELGGGPWELTDVE